MATTRMKLDEIGDSIIETFLANEDELLSSHMPLADQPTITDEIKYSSSVVGFGSTSSGTDTYRFSSPSEPVGSERSLIYQSNNFHDLK